MINRIKSIIARFRNKSTITVTHIARDIKKRPLTNFYLALGLLVLLIIFSNIIRKPTTVTSQEQSRVKAVTLYTIGNVPKISLQAQTEKSGVIEIVAQTGGVVQQIHVQQGQEVSKGSQLISLGSNYQGGNAFSVQRQLAETQYANTEEIYQLQREIIGKQREIATASAESADDLRRITDQSLGDTRRLVETNTELLEQIDETIETLEQNPDANAELLAGAKQQQLQLLNATSQARAGLRNAEYQASETNSPAELTRFQRELTFKQLELQEKSLATAKEAARLQVQLARVSEGLMYPTAPFSGTVQRVFVKVGSVVNPGTPLLVISQTAEEDPITAVAYVPADIARKVSYIEPSLLHISDSTTYEMYPSFITTDAVQGTQYAVYYDIPESLHQDVVSDGYITVDIPVGYADASAAFIYIPIDAVYQTNNEAFVFVEKNGKAKSVSIKLGEVYGNYVEVTEGIQDGDQIIVSRNVVEGDKVEIIK